MGRAAGEDTLNLYDVSAVAHAELIRAGAASSRPRSASRELLADLARPARRAASSAPARDPFARRHVYDDFDAASHSFGLVATAALYRRLTGDTRYDRFATAQRDWVLGANPWGASLMIGVGSRFPRCPQHVVANLTGTATAAPLARRRRQRPQRPLAVLRRLGEFFDEGRTCPRGGDRYGAFTGHGSRFVDDVRSWQTVEPAIDFTATAALAFALTG